MTDTKTPKGFLSLVFRHGGMGLFLPLGLGALLAAISVFINNQAQTFEQQGVVATAEVVGTTLSTRQSIRLGDADSKVPTVTVRFDAGNTTVIATAEISDAQYGELTAGDSVDIRYLPADPKTIEVEARKTRQATLITGLLSATLLVIWILLAIRSVTFARNAIRLRDTGIRKIVEVLEHRAPLMTNDKKPETRLVWQDSSGHQGVSLSLAETLAQKFPVGKEIAIYVSPSSGSLSVWEGDVGARPGIEDTTA